MWLKTKVQTKKIDFIKWCLVLALVAMGVWANYHFVGQALSIKALGWIALLAVIGFIAFTTTHGKEVLVFAREARIELRKVVWPTRQETVQTTLVVMLFVLIIAIILWVMDSGLLWLIGWLTGHRG